MKQKFYPEDVGKPVTYVKTDLSLIHTEIVDFNEGAKYPVLIEKNRLTITEYGSYTNTGICRLFHGHNIKVEISGEEIPKRKKKFWVNVWHDVDGGIYAARYPRKSSAEDDLNVIRDRCEIVIEAQEIEMCME